MESILSAAIIGGAAVLHVAAARYVYVDSERYGMKQRKWTGVSILVPFFGFFAYLFERDYQTREPDDSFETAAGFEIHESRADDVGLDPGGADGETADSDRSEE